MMVLKVWIHDVMKVMKYDLLMGVMGLNKEMQTIIFYVSVDQTVQKPPVGRSIKLVDRASSWVGRADKYNTSSSFM